MLFVEAMMYGLNRMYWGGFPSHPIEPVLRLVVCYEREEKLEILLDTGTAQRLMDKRQWDDETFPVGAVVYVLALMAIAMETLDMEVS